MRVLFDQGTPAPLRRHLSGHEVVTAYERRLQQAAEQHLLDEGQRRQWDERQRLMETHRAAVEEMLQGPI